MEHGVIFEFYDADGKADPRTQSARVHPQGACVTTAVGQPLAFDMIMRLTKSAQM